MRMLADMQEPVAGAIPFKAVELALEYDLDCPDTVDRCRQQQARNAVAASSVRRQDPLGNVGRQLPLRPHVARHQVECGLADESHILRCARRIERAEIRNDRGSVGLLQRDQIGRRIEPEIGEARALVLARIKAPGWLRDVHEVQRHLEMGCKLCWDRERIRVIEAPRVRLGATEPYSLSARPDLGGGDCRGRRGHDAVRLEMQLWQARGTPRQRQGRDEGHHQHARGQHRELARPADQRRLHKTTPPSRMTLRGSMSSTAMKMVRMSFRVSVICSAGLKDCGFAAGLVSSSANHRTISTARSPFDTYGKKELAAKLLLPTRTSRNGWV